MRIVLIILLAFLSFNNSSIAQALSIIWPKSNEVISDRTPLLSWNDVEGASNYQVSISLDSTFSVGVQLFSSSNSPYQLTNNLVSGTWFWKVSSSLNGQNIVSNLGKFQIFEPTDFPSIGLWLRSDSTQVVNGKVTQWYDRSGNNNHSSQNIFASQPNWVSSSLITLKPTISFDGVDDFLNGTVISGINTSSISAFVLAKGNSQNGVAAGFLTVGDLNQGMWLYRRMFSERYTLINNLSSNNQILDIANSTPNSGFNYKLFGIKKTFNTSSSLYINGTLGATSNNASISGMFTNNIYEIGNSSFDKLNGEISEVILFLDAVADPQRNLIEKYVMDRYAPPVNLGADITPIYQNNGTCVNETITASSIYSNYLWSNGASAQSIQVTQPGSYWVQTTDIFGRISRDTILVNNPKMSIFNFQDTIVCFNEALNISPNLPPNHSFTQWQDGNLISNRSFDINNVDNIFSVFFTSSSGCLIHSNSFQIKIDSTLQNITLGADTAICSNSLIQVINSPQIPLTYLWNTSNTNPIQLIQSAGQYWIQVFNGNGCNNSDTIQIGITGEGPLLSVNISNTTCIGTSITFSAQATISPPESIFSYDWHFGNGSTAIGDSVSTSFLTPGTTQVQVSVTASNGCEVVLNQNVQVFPNPGVNIISDGSCIYDSVNFSTQNNGFTILNYEWDLGQNVTSTSTLPSYVYNTAGSYQVNVLVTDQNGCIDTSNLELILSENLENYSNPLSVIWPNRNEVITDRTPLLSWNGVEGVSTYQVSLSLDSTFSSGVQQFSSSSSTYQLTNNLTSGTWFWKVNASLNGQNLSSDLGKFQIFIPTNIGSLKLWLRSDSINILNGKVVQWIDLSLSNNPATQSIVDAQPNFIVNDSRINKPAIQFDGSSDFLTGTTIPNLNSNSISLFMVQSGDLHNGSIASGLFTINNENNGLTIFRRFYQNSHHLSLLNNGDYLFTPNGNLPQSGYNYKITGYRKKFDIQSELYLNNVQVASATNPVLNGTFTNGNFVLGNSNYEKFKGNFTEILLYQTYLSNSELNLVNNYLMDRYAPPVNLGADIIPIYQNNGACVNETITTSSIYTNFTWSTGATTQSIQVTQPGSYWVQTTDIFGRISRDTIAVNYPKMNIFNFQDTLICFNDTLYFNPQIPSGHSFVRWNNCYPSPAFQTSKPGTYFIEFENSAGCLIRSDAFTISVDYSLYNLSLGSDTSLCSGNNIQLQNPPAGITDYAWNTGNTQAIQTVDTTGLYILEVTNTNNCQNRDTVEVTVIGTSPNLQFTFSNTLCQFSPGSFLDNSFVPNGNGTIISKTWSISQGDTLSGSSGNFTIDTSGVFNVTLLAQTQEGCSSSTTFPLVVYPKPIVSFNSEKFCPYDAVEFTVSNSQLSSLSSQLWSFDDNTTSTSPNPTHVFGTTDTYNVSLQAQDINGCRDTVVQPVYIQPQPVADFTFNNSCEQSAVNFVNNSNIVDTFSVVTNQWSYGDNTQATNPSFQKVYQGYGEYNVQLVVTANNGCQDTLSQTITIHPKPILGWQISPACKNTWTTFENQSTIPLGSIAETDWLVNLQYPQEGTSSAYKFVTTGVQYLNLTSTSDQGCTTDTLIIVNVQPEINAAYTVSPTTVVAGVPVVFTNNSLGGTQYEWNLGNNTIYQTTIAEPVEATGFTSSFIGDSILTYLAIQNTIGCKDTAYQYVKVNEPRIDLAINQLFVQDINGFYKVGVELRNLGFVEITQTDLLLKLYNSSPILETETESLAPGESRIYLFNANPSAFVSTQDNEISYLCVEATSYNDYQLIETELSNNISCLNTEGGNFVLLPIYPNPTNDDITYTLIVSEESTISASLTDETGRIVQSSTELFASGLHTPTISMRNLSAGVYYFQITDGVTSKTVKVLKN